jgi:integrase
MGTQETGLTIPLPDSLANFLADLHGQGRLAAPIFRNGSGKVYTQPPHPFRDTLEALGLNEGRARRDRVFHTLRHAKATRLAPGDWKHLVMDLQYAHHDKRAKPGRLGIHVSNSIEK